MAVPKFYDFLIPVLAVLAESKTGEVLSISQVKPDVATRMGLSDEDIAELLPSGRKTRFNDRVEWARTYLKMANLVESPSRGMLRITDEGKKFFESNPNNPLEALNSYESFRRFRYGGGAGELSAALENIDKTESFATPFEIVERNVQSLRELAIAELVERLSGIDPSKFEELVMDLLSKMGYGALGQMSVTGKSGDGGIDGVVNEDKLGLSKIYVQAKRWAGNVGDVEIGRFMGALASRGATKGVFITTSGYTKQAIDTITNNRSSTEVVLIDGKKLSEFMWEYNLGFSIVEEYQVKKVDLDYFE